MLPPNGDSSEGIHNTVVVGETKGERRGVQSASKTETVPEDRSRTTEVNLHGVVKLVDAESVYLYYVEVAKGGEIV